MSPPAAAAPRWWRPAGAAATALALLIGAALALALTLALAPGEAQPRERGSSWSRAPDGYRDLYALLEREGRSVQRLDGDLDALESAGMVVVAWPARPLEAAEEETLLALAERGATLLLALDRSSRLLSSRGIELVEDPVSGADTPGVPSPAALISDPPAGDGRALARPAPGLIPLHAARQGIRLGSMSAGAGEILVLTDPSWLSNRNLSAPANRRLALTLFPEEVGPIVFFEGAHGFDRARGGAAWLIEAGWGPALLYAIGIFGILAWRERTRLPPPPPAPQAPTGLAALARAAGAARMRQGNHQGALQILLAEARRAGGQRSGLSALERRISPAAPRPPDVGRRPPPSPPAPGDAGQPGAGTLSPGDALRLARAIEDLNPAGPARRVRR